MVFGACCIIKDNRITTMNTKSVKIDGVQRGLLVNFEVTQTFYHTEKEAKEATYVFPNDLKICIYDTTFVVGDEIIKPKLQSKEEAKKTYKEAVESGRTAVLGTNIGYGMTQFKLGNVQPETECKVILKIAFTGQMTKEKSFFVKFPIDVYTPSGSKGCLDVNASQFSFQIQTDQETISKVTSNVKNAKFDEATNVLSIANKIENDSNEKSIILTFETKDSLQSSCLITPTDTANFDGCAICVSPNLPPSSDTNSEFVFVIDCSGSMGGNSIKKAAECLELFIKSLPADSFFNIIRFGSRFEKLFESSVIYDDKNSEKAIDLAQHLQANLGGTNIYSPLESLYSEKNEHGQRQVFIMTDGEVSDVERVLELIGSNSNNNRCFTIGIGRGCDAGLVEGMANASGGISDFVQEGDSISEKVIPQLQSSLHPSVTSLELHIEGENNDSFETSPFPLPSVNANGSSVIYLRQKKKGENAFENGILITGSYGSENIEIPVADVQRLVNVEEDKFGCSGGKNIGKAIVPLFAFSILQKLERKRNCSDEDKAKAIELSISSGVLCKYTGYVGMTEQPVIHYEEECCRCCAAPMRHCCCKCCAAAPAMDCKRALRGKGRGSGGRSRGGMKCCAKSAVSDSDSDSETESDSCGDACAPPPRPAAKAASRPAAKAAAAAPPPLRPAVEAASRPPAAADVPSKYDLITLTRYQKVRGFWDDLDTVKKITGVNIDHVDGIDLQDKELEKNCVATIIAIAAMRVKSANERNSWAMIESKAVDWLVKTLPNIDVQQIISKVQSSI